MNIFTQQVQKNLSQPLDNSHTYLGIENNQANLHQQIAVTQNPFQAHNCQIRTHLQL
jgi:hypothetical protein